MLILGSSNYTSITGEKNINCVSNLGNNMTPFPRAIWVNITIFLYNQFDFIKNEKTEKLTVLSGSPD